MIFIWTLVRGLTLTAIQLIHMLYIHPHHDEASGLMRGKRRSAHIDFHRLGGDEHSM